MVVPKIWRVRQGWRKLALGIVAVAGVAAGAFCLGRGSSMPQAEAKQPAPPPVAVTDVPPPTAPEASSDYARRAVAYIYGTIPITREELGEYLIARLGAEKLNLLVNKRIIEHACQQRNIQVAEAEIDAALAEDMKELKLEKKDFEKLLLQRHNKSLYEWREDVVRPKLLMQKMARDRVVVLPDDVTKAFESYYGEKVKCRVIMWPKAEEKKVLNDIYPKIRDNEEEFVRWAKQQASNSLASRGGLIEPMGRYSWGDDELEREVFNLRPGEITSVKCTGEFLVVIKCDGRIPPNTEVKLENVRAELEREILRKRIQQEVPILFAELRKKATPTLYLQKHVYAEDLKRETEQILEDTDPDAGKIKKPGLPPTGN